MGTIISGLKQAGQNFGKNLHTGFYDAHQKYGPDLKTILKNGKNKAFKDTIENATEHPFDILKDAINGALKAFPDENIDTITAEADKVISKSGISRSKLEQDYLGGLDISALTDPESMASVDTGELMKQLGIKTDIPDFDMSSIDTSPTDIKINEEDLMNGNFDINSMVGDNLDQFGVEQFSTDIFKPTSLPDGIPSNINALEEGSNVDLEKTISEMGIQMPEMPGIDTESFINGDIDSLTLVNDPIPDSPTEIDLTPYTSKIKEFSSYIDMSALKETINSSGFESSLDFSKLETMSVDDISSNMDLGLENLGLDLSEIETDNSSMFDDFDISSLKMEDDFDFKNEIDLSDFEGLTMDDFDFTKGAGIDSEFDFNSVLGDVDIPELTPEFEPNTDVNIDSVISQFQMPETDIDISKDMNSIEMPDASTLTSGIETPSISSMIDEIKNQIKIKW